jgi:hypothetical protein
LSALEVIEDEHCAAYDADGGHDGHVATAPMNNRGNEGLVSRLGDKNVLGGDTRHDGSSGCFQESFLGKGHFDICSQSVFIVTAFLGLEYDVLMSIRCCPSTIQIKGLRKI